MSEKVTLVVLFSKPTDRRKRMNGMFNPITDGYGNTTIENVLKRVKGLSRQ